MKKFLSALVVMTSVGMISCQDSAQLSETKEIYLVEEQRLSCKALWHCSEDASIYGQVTSDRRYGAGMEDICVKELSDQLLKSKLCNGGHVIEQNSINVASEKVALPVMSRASRNGQRLHYFLEAMLSHLQTSCQGKECERHWEEYRKLAASLPDWEKYFEEFDMIISQDIATLAEQLSQRICNSRYTFADDGLRWRLILESLEGQLLDFAQRIALKGRISVASHCSRPTWTL